MSDLVTDQRAFENETCRMILAACADEPVLAGQFAEAYSFDGSITVSHGPDESIDPLLPYRIVRRLRGGRDFDPAKPADWHVTGLTPIRRHDRSGHEVVAGTAISFSRTFPAPPDYSEPRA